MRANEKHTHQAETKHAENKHAENKQAGSKVAEELWRRETHELVIHAFRARVLVVPLLLFIGVVFWLFDPSPWKPTLILSATFVVIVMFVLEFVRIRHRRANERTICANLLFGIGVQSLVIFVTGGIASPALVAYVPIVVLAGLSLSNRGLFGSVVGTPVVVIVVLMLGTWAQVVPSIVPTFFGGEGLLFQDDAWLFTRAGVVLLVLGIGAVIGRRVRVAFDRVVLGATQLRASALESLQSRNREILSTGVTIAHELKNPLSSIQGLTQLMARGVSPGSKDAERIDVILREIQRMTTVLDEFRGFTRPLSGLSCCAVSVSELAANVVALHEGTAEKRGVSLKLSSQGDIVAHCDGQKVKQALVNLVQNALEASPKGAEVLVCVLAGPQDTAILRVVDHGPGIDDVLYRKLFTPGFTTKDRGTGIGLVVARSVIEQHGGTLEIQTKWTDGLADGTQATIMLPCEAREGETGL